MTFDFGQRIDLAKAAHDSGFEVIEYTGEFAEAHLSSADAPVRPAVKPSPIGFELVLGDAHLARAVADEARLSLLDSGVFVAGTPDALREMLARAWRLSRALPDAPLRKFEAEIASIPDGVLRTEAVALVRQRRGQSIFRDALLDYWSGRCAVTPVSEPALLRASHMKPWVDCDSDAERLDVFNGLLLTADWDAAFDAGLVTFGDDGHAVFSSRLGGTARARLGEGAIRDDRPLTEQHLPFLAWHRRSVFKA